MESELPLTGPILDLKALHSQEVLPIVRHKSIVQGQGSGGNQQVHVIQTLAFGFKGSLQLSKCFYHRNPNPNDREDVGQPTYDCQVLLTLL